MSWYEFYVKLPNDESILVETDLIGLSQWNEWLASQPPAGWPNWMESKDVKGAALAKMLEKRKKEDRFLLLDKAKRSKESTLEGLVKLLEPELDYPAESFEI